ncbi:MAG: NAD(P)H-hydrate dehydratase [Bacteroidia bacterium]|nr:NAD(P)H-hydrate dehydratase [Bacteroidia bacterium]MDW8158585.1 NAD(P)H-hydrate dehydratase [Bacteroidia bacterium]
MLVANSAQIREIDRIMIEEYDFPGILLMETAGRKAADIILSRYPEAQHFLVLCGPGNNGGDGAVTARYLDYAGKEVKVIYTEYPTRGDAYTNFLILKNQGIPFWLDTPENEPLLESELEKNPIVIDALFGTGLRQKFKEPIKKLLKTIQEREPKVVAIDLPSGLIGDTGTLVNIPLKCDCTITFQLPKICHYVTPASLYCGKVYVVDIHIYQNIVERLGIKTEVINDELIQNWYKKREANSHKGMFGHVLCAGGSKGKGGAMGLCAKGVINAGAGLCTAFIPGSVRASFHRSNLEGMSIAYGTDTTPYLNGIAAEVFLTYLTGKNVVAIGPGLGVTEETTTFLKEVLPHIQVPLVLDADALNILAENPNFWELLPTSQKSNVIITPHPGEMARLMHTTTEAIQERRFEMALKLATEKKVIVVLKGAGTIIASPIGSIYLNPVSNSGMASAGVGDVLTGIIAGFAAQGYNPLKAAAMGVYLHSQSAQIVSASFGAEGTTASKIARGIGLALKQALTNKSPTVEKALFY